jgi:Tol biopolymer transport system component
LRTSPDDRGGIIIGDIEAAPEQQSSTRLLAAGQGASYVPANGSARGQVLFVRGNQLMAQPFDEGSRTLQGEAANVVEQVASTEIFGSFGVSENGTLAYMRASSDTGSLVWVSREGKELTPIAAGLRRLQNPRLSHDGRSLAAVVNGEIWAYDLAGRPPIKVTFDGNHFSPIWSPDNLRILYEVGGARGIGSVPADGSGMPEQFGPLGHFHPHGWTSGGTDLVSVRMNDETNKTADLVRFSSSPESQPQTIVATPAADGLAGAVSPDGRWLAYSSDATGQTEIWVRPLPGPGPAVRISPNSGFDPAWSRTAGRSSIWRAPT